MNLFTGLESRELFGGEVSAPVARLLEQVREAPREQAAALLWTAQVSDPGCLPVYYLLYKLHASLGEFDRAEKAALRGLSAAAGPTGLPEDWSRVTCDMADFDAPGPARFWLFTLKALAFIRVRQRRPDSAQVLVAKVRELDPRDGMGAGVVEALLRSSGPRAG